MEIAVTILIVGSAVVYLMRRFSRYIRAAKSDAAGCGGCGCGKPARRSKGPDAGTL
ncbi:MAG: hypothetical protein K1X83_03385 [Oligoflexia bacterium]|nr:hypothetical protein [Oligoflexia bacterium]